MNCAQHIASANTHGNFINRRRGQSVNLTMPLHLVDFTSTPLIQLTSLNSSYSGFRTKVPLHPVQPTCSVYLSSFAEDYRYRAEMLLRHVTPCSLLDRWRWRQQVPANVGAYPSNYPTLHAAKPLWQHFLSMTASLSQILKLHEEDVSPSVTSKCCLQI